MGQVVSQTPGVAHAWSAPENQLQAWGALKAAKPLLTAPNSDSDTASCSDASSNSDRTTTAGSDTASNSDSDTATPKSLPYIDKDNAPPSPRNIGAAAVSYDDGQASW